VPAGDVRGEAEELPAAAKKAVAVTTAKTSILRRNMILPFLRRHERVEQLMSYHPLEGAVKNI
jgi:hypothetical protein